MGTYKFKIGGKTYDVAVNSIEAGNANVTVNGTQYDVEICDAPAAAVAAAPAPATAQAPASAPAPAATTAPANAGGKKIKSPLPGVIVDVCVKEGQSVKRGQKIAVIEAMKMENEIQAECDGTVAEVFVKKGDSVLEGAEIATIA